MARIARPIDEDATLDSLLHALTPVEERRLLEDLALVEDEEDTLDDRDPPWLVSRLTALLGDLLAISR